MLHANFLFFLFSIDSGSVHWKVLDKCIDSLGLLAWYLYVCRQNFTLKGAASLIKRAS